MRTLCLLMAAVFLGCSPAVPGQPVSPAGPGGWTFEPTPGTAAGEAARVRLEVTQAPGDEVTVQVLAEGMREVSGLAFRVTLEGDGELLGAETGPAFTGSSVGVLSRFALRSPRELWGGVALEGKHGVAAKSPAVLARLRVRLGGAGNVELRFAPARNAVLSPDPAERFEPEWLGGTFSRG